jgi:hypothetical protein
VLHAYLITQLLSELRAVLVVVEVLRSFKKTAMATSQMVLDEGMQRKTSHKKTILLGVAVLAVIIIVRVLAGVLSGNREKDKCDERINEAVHKARLEERSKTTPGVPTTPGAPTTSAGTTSAGTTVGRTTPKLEPWNKIRLPTDINPVHYDMLIRVYLDTLNFSGDSNITINVKNPTDKILFHINKINITNVEVVDFDSSEVLTIDRQFSSPKRQFYVVILTKDMAVRRHVLKLSFVANIETEELNGFYKSTYKNSAGETRYASF